MYGRERRVLLRHYLEQGLSKAEIARTLQVSRRTLYHWIDNGQLDRDLDNGPLRYRAPAGSAQDRPIPGDHPSPIGRVPQAQRHPLV
jgi:transposase-like protein